MDKLNQTFKINPLYESDGYKVGHKAMLAPGTTKLYGTWIPRSLKYMQGIDQIMSAGQQMVVRYLHSTFAENFFFISLEGRKKADKGSIEMFKRKAMNFVSDMSVYLGMEYDGKHFEDLWDLGYLPIKVKALPEGMFTDPNIPHMTFVNTVDGYAWLTLFLETYISKLAWQLPVAATIGHKFRQNANQAVLKSDPTNLWLADFMCHDFHSRGGNPFTSIAVGLGHAISNKGSDTLNVIPAARYYYDEPEDSMPVFSVNASEHSVSTTKIFTVGEQQMIADWLKLFPKGILSVVADTFSTWEFIKYCGELKDEILARDGKVVCRPDSGDPVDIICGTNIKSYDTLEKAKIYFKDELYDNQIHGEAEFEIDTEITVRVGENLFKLVADVDWNRYDKQYYFIESIDIKAEETETTSSNKGVIELLWDIFGGTINEQGFKVLDPHIGAIYGDSINLERQEQIYERLAAKGFAATNIVLGVGSFTYVYQTRDSAGFAAKGSWFEVRKDNRSLQDPAAEDSFESYNIYKDPITDDGQKKSLKGLVSVHQVTDEDGNEHIVVMQECTPEDEDKGLLQVIYQDGKFYNQTTLQEIRERVLSNI